MCPPAEIDQVKVDKWDGAAVRNALDDEIRHILTKDLKYEENHALPDGRLAISVLAVGAAGWALLWDWWYPFPASRNVLIACVVSYFILMGILTLYTNYFENGIFVVAKKKDEVGLEPAKVFTARSQLQRFDDMYNLELSVFVEGKRSDTFNKATLDKSIASWIDTKGVLRKDLLRKDVDRLLKVLLENKKAK